MTVQKADLVSCDTPGCFGSLLYLGGPMTAQQVAKSCGWHTAVATWDSAHDTHFCPACVQGRGPITKTACPSCGGSGGNLVCVYCGAEQPRDLED